LISTIERNPTMAGQCSAMAARVSRQMVWTKTPQMEAWTCFACSWAFQPFGPPRGNSMQEMMTNYELQRDKEYASHVCTDSPKLQIGRDPSKIPAHPGIELAVRVRSIGMIARA
jgi:hypothetical protein